MSDDGGGRNGGRRYKPTTSLILTALDFNQRRILSFPSALAALNILLQGRIHLNCFATSAPIESFFRTNLKLISFNVISAMTVLTELNTEQI